MYGEGFFDFGWSLRELLLEKDMLLQEMQHRVANSL